MDLCRSCSKVWLDGGEIAAIQAESLVSTVGNLFRWMRGGKDHARKHPPPSV
jgi:Zn-finger nucleic acid-binding protein